MDKIGKQISELGTAFQETRTFLGLSYYDIEGEGLSHVISRKIEEGGNFTMKSMYRYLSILGHHGIGSLALLDETEQFGKDVSNMQRLGEALKVYRMVKHKTLSDMLLECGLRNNQIINIEKGNSCNSKTLQSYLSIFPDLYFDIPLL